MQETRRKARPGLSVRDRTVLDLEQKWGSGLEKQAQKLAEAEETLGLSASAYALVLRALLADPLALEYAPETVQALREVRDARDGGGDKLKYGGLGRPVG